MTEISLDIDTNQRKGKGPVPMQHHKTSCSWYAWQKNIPNSFQMPCIKTLQKTEPSDQFHYRINRVKNNKEILSKSIKKSCYENGNKNGNVLNERNIVPGGEARDYNTFAFSQHDNRHKIQLPAKKHGVKENIVIQSKSDNVSDTLSWTNSCLPNIEATGNQNRQRSYTSSQIHRKANTKRTDFRRFPKSHDFSQRSQFERYSNFKEKSPIVAHDVNSSKDNYLKPKSELISLQNLVQPQNYSGASIPSRDKIRSRGDTAGSSRNINSEKLPWSYAYNLKSHSAKIGQNTKYACFRF